MKNNRCLTVRALVLVIFFVPWFGSYGQNVPDSLSLNYILSEVLKNHPLVKQEELGVSTANAKADLAKVILYPNVDFSASYTRIGPVPQMELGGKAFDLSKAGIFNSKVSAFQNIYDFGKTSANIEFAEKNKNMAELSIEQIKQKLTSAVVNNFYVLNYIQQAVKIKDEQLKTLNEHLAFVQKKKDAGAAINYEILTTKVRISNVENQKTDLLSAQKIQLGILNSLLGLPENAPHNVKGELNIDLPALSGESLLATAIKNRPEVKILEQKTLLSKLQYNIFDNQNNPSFDFFASAGFQNNMKPDLDKIRANYVAGVEFKIPIFDGNKSKNNLIIASTAIEASKFETENTKRSISNEVIECNANVEANLKKIDQSVLQVKQAEEAFKLAENNYNAGGITNLELLDSETSLSEVKLGLLKSKIDYVLSVYKLKIALGEKLY